VQVVGVSELTRYLRNVFDSDPRLQSLWIEGEVSNFKRSAPGHLYFTLKDATAQLPCVWFAGNISARARIPRDGDHVVALGRISVYEARGIYQMNVTVLQPAGAGELALQQIELRARLEGEGLFDPDRKRMLPRFPATIGVVTSPSGAVWRDIAQVLARRYTGAEVVLAPTPVQGEGAAEQIAAAIEVLNAFVHPDVIIVARGGGSHEDLGAFNQEVVVRAIHASKAPVVSAVGHETDRTLADEVADLRASTPSAAAELVVPDGRELADQIDRARRQLEMLVRSHVGRARARVERLDARLTRLSPANVIAGRRQEVDDLAERALAILQNRLRLSRVELVGRAHQMEALSPLAVLARGYSITRLRSTGQVVRRPADVHPGAGIDVRVAEGQFGATVDRAVWTQAPIPTDVPGGNDGGR
jgi:exodeoxyribonuclease VII large subunit